MDPVDIGLFARPRDKLLRQTPLTIEYWLRTVDIAVRQQQRRAPAFHTIDIAAYFDATSGNEADNEATGSSGSFEESGDGDISNGASTSSESSVASFDLSLPSYHSDTIGLLSSLGSAGVQPPPGGVPCS